MLAGGVALFCKVFSFKISEEYNDTVMKIRKFVDLSVYYFFKTMANSVVNNSKSITCWNAKFSVYISITYAIYFQKVFNFHDCTLNLPFIRYMSQNFDQKLSVLK